MTVPYMDNPWMDKNIQHLATQVRYELLRLHHRIDELEEFIKYVDATAPELRTAYHVSKLIE